MTERQVSLRWTIGDVSDYGFEALRLSVWGARKLFGADARYTICVNTVPIERAQALTGELPEGIDWYRSTRDQVPQFIIEHLDPAMAEGVGWKWAPLHVHHDRYEIALDNDVILWEMPTAMRDWLEDGGLDVCLSAQDVAFGFGQFAPFGPDEPRNSGIRGLPPGWDLEGALRELLETNNVVMTSELDEQGLQVAAVRLEREPYVVQVREVTICSPWPPHLPHLGTHGAHFVGLNSKNLPWEHEGRPASEYTRENFGRHREELYRRVGRRQ